MEIISMAQAKKKGARYYFTGKPCSRGHVAWRYVSTRNCSDCVAEDRGQAEIERRHKSHDEVLTPVNLVLYPDQMQIAVDTAHALCESKYPGRKLTVLMGDRYVDGSVRKFIVRVPPEYYQLMFDTGEALRTSRGRVDIEAARDRAFGRALAIGGQ